MSADNFRSDLGTAGGIFLSREEAGQFVGLPPSGQMNEIIGFAQ
jgi:hypothetical protein